MKLKKNWEIKAGFFSKVKNLYKKGGFDPRFYLYRYRFNTYSKRFKIGAFPLDVIAETANLCNLRCVMCFHADNPEQHLPVTETTNVRLMAMDTFKKIVDECAKNGLPALKLSWRGEPMLNKKFTEMLRYAKAKGILEVTSLTNATLMNETICREIVSAKLDQIIISIDGFTKETYEKIRIGADFDEVMNNVMTLIKIRNKASKPFIRIQYTESAVNRHETADFYAYWKDKVDEVTISYCQDFGSPDKNNPGNVPIHEFCCEQIFQRLVVMTDGTVNVCATDVMGNLAIGNVHDSSLFDLWHGPKLSKLRELHRSGKYYLMPMCRICANNTFKANTDAGRL